MPTPIPTPVASDSTGLPDSQWITDVRDALRDYPTPINETWTADGVGGVFGANSAPLTLKNLIYDGIPVANYISVTNGGAAQTVITTGTPGANQVLVDYYKRTLTFSAAPASSNVVNIGYYSCKWTDASILTALYAGLRAMFPRVGKTYTDTSINIAVNTWDYTLPVWCQDPRSRIYSVEVKDPYITVEPWRPIRGGFNRVDLTTLQLPYAQRYSPAAKLRVVGWGPYLTLGDLEPQLYHLPIWYALGTLLPKQDTFRLRQDTMVPLTQEGGQTPMMLTNSGSFFMKQFEAELDRLSRLLGPGVRAGVRTVYESAARR